MALNEMFPTILGNCGALPTYNLQFGQLLSIFSVPYSPPPRKIPNPERREREFLYLSEIDALIAACHQTRTPIRNQTLAMLLFCQALQLYAAGCAGATSIKLPKPCWLSATALSHCASNRKLWSTAAFTSC